MPHEIDLQTLHKKLAPKYLHVMSENSREARESPTANAEMHSLVSEIIAEELAEHIHGKQAREAFPQAQADLSFLHAYFQQHSPAVAAVQGMEVDAALRLFEIHLRNNDARLKKLAQRPGKPAQAEKRELEQESKKLREYIKGVDKPRLRDVPETVLSELAKHPLVTNHNYYLEELRHGAQERLDNLNLPTRVLFAFDSLRSKLLNSPEMRRHLELLKKMRRE